MGDGGPHEPEPRLRLVDLATDPGAGEVTVRLARGDDEALGRASTAGGLPAAVEATIVAVRTFVPRLPYLPGWARTVETTPTGGSWWSRRSPTRSPAPIAAAPARRPATPSRARSAPPSPRSTAPSAATCSA